ncbi:MAG TPA: hypothetical protein PKD45_09430 [Flavobacteriales bacterium]|nr:hypothetical protein [Flavobacteriales bacterium]
MQKLTTMRPLFRDLYRHLLAFEAWFDRRYGWFFTNGMKQDRTVRTGPDTDVRDVAPL